ncbi:DUF296 domain-containing protein [uncultured Photobacterium sp.]|uniref:PCC domain-containing protein n=1 Tax=uncultured Photobacterium sp. TaxID=173973 RepID=UPI00341C511D
MITPHAKRLLKGDDLRHSLLEFIQLNKIQSGSLLTGVGCLSQVKIRLAKNIRSRWTIRNYIFVWNINT